MSVIRYQVEWPGSRPLILGKSLDYPALVPDGDGESFLCVEKPRRVIVPKLIRLDSGMADAMADAWNEISKPGDDAILLSVRFHYRDTLETDIDGEDPIVDYGYLCFVPSDEGWTTLREAGATAIPAVSLLDLKIDRFPMVENQSLKNIQEIEDRRMLEVLDEISAGGVLEEETKPEVDDFDTLYRLYQEGSVSTGVILNALKIDFPVWDELFIDTMRGINDTHVETVTDQIIRDQLTLAYTKKMVDDARQEGTEVSLLTTLWKDSPEVPALFQGKKNVGAQLVSLEPDEAAEVLRNQKVATLGQVSERDLSRTVPLPWNGTHRFETYKVMQRVHLGGPEIDLWEGTRVEFDGEILRVPDGDYRVPNLRQAIGLGWLVRDPTLLIRTGQRCGMTDFGRIQTVYEMARIPLEEVPEDKRFEVVVPPKVEIPPFELVSNYEISAYDLLNQTHAKYTFEHAGDGMATVRHTASGLTKLFKTVDLLKVRPSEMAEVFYDG